MTDLKISQFSNGSTIQITDEIATNRGGINTKVFVGSAATLDAGTGIGDVVVLEDVGGSPALPAVDGSQLTNIPAGAVDAEDVTFTPDSSMVITASATDVFEAIDLLDAAIVAGGGGAVDSVNGQTGVVVLDADDIDDAATTNKFTTSSDISKLAGIESGADVTDATNVNAAGAVMESDYDANTILAATSDNTPVTLTVPEQTLVGRITSGAIDALTATEVRTLLNVEDGAEVNPTTEEIQDSAWSVLSTGTQTLITVIYQDATNDVDFVVDDDLSNYDNTTSAFITSAGAPVQSVNAATGAVVLDAEDIAFTDPDGTVSADDVEEALEILGLRSTQSFCLAVSDETSNLTIGDNKITFILPYTFLIYEVQASVTTAPTGSTIIVDVNAGGSSILSTKITIDAGEKTSITAAVPAVISSAAHLKGTEFTIDLDQIGSTIAGTGLKIYLLGIASYIPA